MTQYKIFQKQIERESHCYVLSKQQRNLINIQQMNDPERNFPMLYLKNKTKKIIHESVLIINSGLKPQKGKTASFACDSP